VERRDLVGELSGTGATTSKQATVLVVLLVDDRAAGWVSGVVTEDGNVARSLEGQSAVDVLQENATSSTVTADELGVVAADITADLASQVVLAGPGVAGRESVEVST